jgi:hypothetical protein
MPRLFILTLAVLALAGCGTDVPALLEADSELAWEAEDLMAEAERKRLAELESYQEAHATKEDLCEPLYSKAQTRIDDGMSGKDLPVTERFWSDLMIVGALIFPVGAVEQCAAAFERYQSAHNSLADRVQDPHAVTREHSDDQGSWEWLAESRSFAEDQAAISPRNSSATFR